MISEFTDVRKIVSTLKPGIKTRTSLNESERAAIEELKQLVRSIPNRRLPCSTADLERLIQDFCSLHLASSTTKLDHAFRPDEGGDDPASDDSSPFANTVATSALTLPDVRDRLVSLAGRVVHELDRIESLIRKGAADQETRDREQVVLLQQMIDAEPKLGALCEVYLACATSEDVVTLKVVKDLYNIVASWIRKTDRYRGLNLNRADFDATFARLRNIPHKSTHHDSGRSWTNFLSSYTPTSLQPQRKKSA